MGLLGSLFKEPWWKKGEDSLELNRELPWGSCTEISMGENMQELLRCVLLLDKRICKLEEDTKKRD